jgi:hypothetical protein
MDRVFNYILWCHAFSDFVWCLAYPGFQWCHICLPGMLCLYTKGIWEIKSWSWAFILDNLASLLFSVSTCMQLIQQERCKQQLNKAGSTNTASSKIVTHLREGLSEPGTRRWQPDEVTTSLAAAAAAGTAAAGTAGEAGRPTRDLMEGLKASSAVSLSSSPTAAVPSSGYLTPDWSGPPNGCVW